MDEIIRCMNCKHYEMGVTDGQGKCSHINALPFPNPMDFCSMAVPSDRGNNFNSLSKDQQLELLNRIREQRRS